MKAKRKTGRLPFPMSGDNLTDAVELLDDAKETSDQVRNYVETIRYCAEEEKAKDTAEKVVLRGQDLVNDLTLAVQKLERVDRDIEIVLPEVEGIELPSGTYPERTMDKGGMIIRLRDVRDECNNDVVGICNDIRKGLTSPDDIEECHFYDPQANPRGGHQILCVCLEGLREYL